MEPKFAGAYCPLVLVKPLENADEALQVFTMPTIVLALPPLLLASFSLLLQVRVGSVPGLNISGAARAHDTHVSIHNAGGLRKTCTYLDGRSQAFIVEPRSCCARSSQGNAF
jgi:hypothetical protein